MKNYLSETIKNKIRQFCEENPKEESCGFIISCKSGLIVHPCENISEDKRKAFLISKKDKELAESKGKIVSYYHSHPDGGDFSLIDKYISEKNNTQVILYTKGDFKVYNPKGRVIPYVNRPFFAGIIDCVSLAQDFYKNEYNITIPEFEHELRYLDNWLKHLSILKRNNKSNNEALLEFYKSCGFKKVSNLKHGDILLLREKLLFPNNVAIYIEPNNILLQRESRSFYDYYDERYSKPLAHILRHKTL